MRKYSYLQVSDAYIPIMDGVTNVVRNYSYWLNRKYGQCILAAPNCHGYIDNEEFEVIRYFSVPLKFREPYKMGFDILDFKFWKYMNKLNFDIVHSHSPFISATIGLNISRRRNIPLIATFHSKYYDDFKQVFKLDILAQLFTNMIINFYNKADQVWTVNTSTADTLREYGYKGNIEIVENGCDEFNTNKNIGCKIIDIENRLNLKNNESVLLFIGQHIWQKNHKMLLEALKLLKNINFKMIFVGEGYAKDKMIEYAHKLKINNKLVFMGKLIDRDLIAALFKRADLFLFPSLYDNASIVIREAASMKTPSLLIEGSNTAEGIYDNYNGFLSKNNPYDYSNRIREILTDKNLIQSTGEMAFKTLAKRWEDIVDEVYSRYDELIKYKNMRHKRAIFNFLR